MAKLGDLIALHVGSVYTVRVPAIGDDPEQIVKGKYTKTVMAKDATGTIAIRAAEGTVIQFKLGSEYPEATAMIENDEGTWEMSIYWILDSGHGDLTPFDPFGKGPEHDMYRPIRTAPPTKVC